MNGWVIRLSNFSGEITAFNEVFFSSILNASWYILSFDIAKFKPDSALSLACIESCSLYTFILLIEVLYVNVARMNVKSAILLITRSKPTPLFVNEYPNIILDNFIIINPPADRHLGHSW